MDRKYLKNFPRKLELEPPNAAVNYHASGSFSLPISSSSSGGGSSIYTRCMVFYDRNSMRIEGNEGEFDMICRSLGLSGPEDFAVPAAAWEAMQVPSSSEMVPRLKLGLLKEGQEVTEERENDVTEGGGVCEGIEGGRPPMLPPPPGMRIPVVDDMCSAWDLIRGFAPQGEGHSLSDSEDEQGERREQEDDEEEEVGGGGVSPKREEEEEGMDNAARLVEIVAELPESNENVTSTGIELN